MNQKKKKWKMEKWIFLAGALVVVVLSTLMISGGGITGIAVGGGNLGVGLPTEENLILDETVIDEETVVSAEEIKEAEILEVKEDLDSGRIRGQGDLGIQANVDSCGTLSTVEETYILTQNVNSNGTCFTINASSMTLDCAGYIINYSTAGILGYGVNNTGGYDNVTIRNCNIYEGNATTSSKYAIYFNNVENGTIENSNITTIGENGYGIYFLNSLQCDVNLSNIITYGDGAKGVHEYLSSSSSFAYNNITAYGNSLIAFHLQQSHNSTSLLNKITTNGTGSYAVTIAGSNWTTFDSNVINTYGNAAVGIALSEYSGSPAANNVLVNNNISVNYSGAGNWEIRDDSSSSDVNYLVYNNSYGEIKWIDNGTGSFVRDLDLDGKVGLGINLFIGANVGALNTSAFDLTVSRINSSANITLKEINFTHITEIYKLSNFSTNSSEILLDGEDCLGSSCFQLDIGLRKVIFNTSSFSSFMVNGTDANLNTAPNTTLVLVNASTINNKTTDDLLCWARGEDDEHTLLQAYWVWYKDGVSFSSGSTEVNNGSLTNLAIVHSENTSIGENWTCSVKMDDGLDNESEFNNASVVVSSLVCGEEVASSTNMTADILDCTNDFALNITADDIILDCGGYRLTGNGSFGVYVGWKDNITIKNCRISGFENSIYFDNITSGVIFNNTITNSTRLGIYINVNNGTQILGNVISDTATAGILMNTSNCNNQIINNTVLNNNGTPDYISGWNYAGGISLIGRAIAAHINKNNLIQGNNLSHNIPQGFFVAGWNNTFEDNFLDNNSVGYTLLNYPNNFTSEIVINHSVGVNITSTLSSYANQGFIFYSSFFDNDVDDLYIIEGLETNITFVNTTIDRNRLSVPPNSWAYFKSYVDANVTNSLGNSLENATVTGYSSIGDVEDTELTDSDGFSRLEITEFYRTNDVNYIITPSVIEASKNNYTHNNTSVNLYNITYAIVNLSLTEVSCGSTIYGDLDLGNNFECEDSGLVVGIDNIIIDGNGYNLTGNGSGIGINLNGKRSIGVKNMQTTNFTTGLYFLNTNNSNLTNLRVVNNTRGLVFNSSHDNVVYGSVFGNNSEFSVFAVNDGGTNNSLVNVSIDLDNISISGTANVFLKWYVDVNATYNVDNALPNANAYGYFNSTLLLDDSETTNSDGEARLVLTELKKNNSGITYLTPHNITLLYEYKNTNLTNSTTINLTQTNNALVHLSLILNCTAPYSNINITNDTTFCPGTFAVENVNIAADNVSLTCEDTVLQGSATQSGILIEQKSNVTISGCNLDGYVRGFDLDNANNVTINNISVTSDNGRGLHCERSRDLLLNRSYFSNNIDIYSYSGSTSGCNNSIIVSNTFRGSSINIFLVSSFNNIVRNNTFSGGTTGIQFGTAGNNSFYQNSFSDISAYYVDYRSVSGYENYFNTSVNVSGNMSGQGNQWEDYCDKGVDLNGDGYADNVSSASANDWPYSENISSKIYDPTSGNTGVIDYGPKITTCPAEEVFLGDGGGGGRAAEEVEEAEEAVEEEIPTPVKKEEEIEEAVEAEVYGAEEAAKYLKKEVKTQKVTEQITQVLVILENTGTKRMQLFPALFQDIEDPFFIVTKKTLGFEGSLFSRISSISYSEDSVAGRLLQATVLNPEQIILDPGERIEKILEINEGLVAPRQIKIQFTTLGETVFEQEIEIKRKAISGTAVDDTEEGLLDVYAIIVPVEISEKLGEYYEEAITGAAVADVVKEGVNEYLLELNINKKEGLEVLENALPMRFLLAEKIAGLFLGKKASFSDIYGPYEIKEEQSFIFAQQLKYDPRTYSGEHEVKTKIYQDDEVVVENEFEVVLGEEVEEMIKEVEELAAAEEEEEKWSLKENVFSVGKAIAGKGKKIIRNGKKISFMKIWLMPMVTVLIILVMALYMVAVRMKERRKLKERNKTKDL